MELPGQDSNLGHRSQSPVCYHYTTGQRHLHTNLLLARVGRAEREMVCLRTTWQRGQPAVLTPQAGRSPPASCSPESIATRRCRFTDQPTPKTWGVNSRGSLGFHHRSRSRPNVGNRKSYGTPRRLPSGRLSRYAYTAAATVNAVTMIRQVADSLTILAPLFWNNEPALFRSARLRRASIVPWRREEV